MFVFQILILYIFRDSLLKLSHFKFDRKLKNLNGIIRTSEVFLK